MTSSGTIVDLKLLYDRQGEKVAFPIEEGETFIGRKDYCDICFPDSSVSKRHVRIVRAGAKVELHDAGSRNGTLVNGQTVTAPVALRDGDVIQLGKIVLTVAGGAKGNELKRESRSQKSKDSFRDFDDFDEGTDDQEAAKQSRAPVASTKKMDPKGLQEAAASGAKEPPASKELAPLLPPSTDLPPKTRFAIVGGDGKGKVIELSPDAPITLGTKDENTIPLKGEGISRYHAEVVVENGAWVLKDLGSRNGTFVGERKVDLHELAPGDIVMIGTVYLRFEQETKRAPGSPIGAQAKELLDLLKKDPKAFIQSSSGRRALMIVLSLLIAFVLFAPQSGPSGDPGGGGGGADPEVSALPHQVIEYLKNDQAQKARDLIARTRAAFRPGQDRPYLADLDELAKIWCDHQAPLTFEWKNAIQSLDKAQRNGVNELDQDCMAWLKKAQKDVETELPNSKLLFKGQGEMTAATNATRRGDVKEALAQYRNAYKTFNEIPKTATVYPLGKTQCDRARQALFKLLQKEAERLVTIDPPPWQDAIDRLNEALEFANTLEEKAPVRRRVEECEANQRDEDAFARAVDIVQQRNTARYEDAIQLLSGISKTSRVYVDGQTYLHWIQADRDVRNAKIAYDEGNWEKAKTLLQGALKVNELGPDAKASVTRRLELWSSVEQSLREGLALSTKGDDAGALVKLDNVLKLEPNAKNRYHVLAEGEINNIHDRGDRWVDQKLQEGLEALDRARWKDAYDRFKFVIEHAKDNKARSERIEKAVQELNQRKRIYQDCYKRWVTNENAMYEGLLDPLRVLARFLPKSDPEKALSFELFKKVKTRLKVAMDQHKQDDDDQQK